MQGSAQAVRARALPATPTTEFEEVYREHYGFVWGSLRRLGVPESSVADATQEVFVVAYRRMEEFEYRASWRTWLFAIARRVAAHQRRTTARDTRRLGALGMANLVSNTAVGASSPEKIAAVRFLEVFLDGLGDEQRAVFVLSELHGMSGPEIAQTLELNLNTAYTRVRAVRTALSRALARVRAREAREVAWADRDGVIAAANDADRPPRSQMARAWILFPGSLEGLGGPVAPGPAAKVTAVAVGKTSGASGLAVGLKTVMVSACLGAAGATGALVADLGGHGAVSPPGSPVVEAAAQPAPRPPQERGAAPTTAMPGWAVASGGSTESVQDGATVARKHIPGSRRTASARPASPAPDPSKQGPAPLASKDPAPAPNPAAAEGTPAPSHPPSLSPDEVMLLSRARQALEQGDAAGAMRWIEQHEKSYDSGELRVLRKALRIAALCGLGRIGEARAGAKKFLADHPGSPHARFARKGCVTGDRN